MEIPFPFLTNLCKHQNFIAVDLIGSRFTRTVKIVFYFYRSPDSSSIHYYLGHTRLWDNRPFPSSPQSLFQSESKCKIFVMVISSNFNVNEN